MKSRPFIGIVLGLIGLIVWCVGIYMKSPVEGDRLDFFVFYLKLLPWVAYITPLCFILYAVSSILRRRVSMAAFGILLVFMSIADISAGGIGSDVIAVLVISVLCLLYPAFFGTGRRL